MVSTFEFAENVVGVMIDSDINDDIMKELISIVSEKIEDHGQINLFCELKKGNRLSFLALLRNLKFNFEHIENFNKVAIVTDLTWIQNAAEVKDVMVGADIEIFSNENRLSALNWISE